MPSGLAGIDVSQETSPYTVGSAAIGGNFAQSAANYMHIKAIDAVGNAAYAHKVFGFDNVVPPQPTVSFSHAAFSSTAASINISYSDATSGVTKMRVAGDITNGTLAET